MDVSCPSGLKGTIRKPKVKDINDLRKVGTSRGGAPRAYGNLIRGCWEKTTDKGPYQWNDDPDAVPWDDVDSADRFFLLLKLREALFGPRYKFQTACGSCGTRYAWEVNTAEDMTVRPISPRTLEVMRSEDKLFHDKTLDGRDVAWKLGTGRLEVQIDPQEEAMIRTLLPRVHTLAGQAQPKQIREALLDMDHDVFDHLQGMINENDFGVETGILTVCPKCQAQNETELPFDRSFFFPHSTR